MKIVKKPWGREEWWADAPGLYLGKTLYVEVGQRLSLQYHVDKTETLMGQSGQGLVRLGETLDTVKLMPMRPGVVVHVPAGWVHRVENTGTTTLVLTEVSTHHPDDVVRMSDDYERNGESGASVGGARILSIAEYRRQAGYATGETAE